MGKCSCCGNRSEHGAKMFSFPRNPVRRKLWMDNVNRFRPNWIPTNNSKICEVHFPDTDFVEVGGIQRMTKDAVPILFSLEDSEKLEALNRAKFCLEFDHDYGSIPSVKTAPAPPAC